MTRDERIRALYRARPVSWFARGSVFALGLIVAWAWIFGDLELARLFSGRSADNLARFLRDVRPYPLWDRPWDWGVAGDWLAATLAGKGTRAVLATTALSVAAICLAGVLAGLTCLLAARNVARAEPFLPGPRPPHPLRRALWHGIVLATRLAYIFVRAIPEYIWAFLLLALFGLGAWPAVLALALHNAGILGKLDAEVVENLDPGTPRALRGLGAGRLQIATAYVFPSALGRFLLYFFYRWETCVREATVLGLLGFVSLGWYVQQARAGVRYDEMLLFILLASALIVAGDLVSAGARALLRRSA